MNNITPYYRAPGILIFNNDFRDLLPYPKRSLIVCDPPYNINFKYDTYRDNVRPQEYIKMISHLKGYRVIIIQYPEEMQRLIVPALGAPDHTSIWCYNSNLRRRARLINYYNVKPDYSLIKQPYKNPNDKRIKHLIEHGNVGTNLYEYWTDIQLVKNVSKEKTSHPCQIPEALIERLLILTGSVTNDIIIDPFAGSLTTNVVAHRLGFDTIGFELSKQYIMEGLCRFSRKYEI